MTPTRIRALTLQAICLGACLLAFGCKRHDSLQASVLHPVLSADGREHVITVLTWKSGDALPAAEMRARGEAVRLVQVDSRSVQLLARAPVNPGSKEYRVDSGTSSKKLKVSYTLDSADSYDDGTPDFIRLHATDDQAAFRKWFVGLVEMQADLPQGKTAPEIQDCAALLRYAYREALHAHDEAWQQEHPGLADLQSVHQYTYPDTPLGAALFRVRSGAFAPGDLKDGTFAQFADAHTLLALNTYRVGRRLEGARQGDLLFFRQLEQNSPYHSMVVAGAHADWVVYHTGPIGRGPGEIRRVAMNDLLHHPDVRWRPLAENSNFLGVYRWNILRDAN